MGGAVPHRVCLLALAFVLGCGGGEGSSPPPAPAAPTYSISGIVSGPWVEGITVTLTGDASGTAVTGAGGTYGFSGLEPGTYAVEPSLEGYSFTPAAHSVAIANANVTLDFTQASTVASYGISGAVSYSGDRPGRVYVMARPAGCVDDSCAAAGTSVVRTGDSTPYELRGLGPGSYVVSAWIDNLGWGQRNATNPAGQSSAVNIDVAGATGIDIAVADPTIPLPEPPTRVAAFPGNGSALVLWDPSAPFNDAEAATAYIVYWSTDPSFSLDVGFAEVPARDDPHYFVFGLADDTPYYFAVASIVVDEQNPSEAAYANPVTIGPPIGASTVSGAVTFTSDATGPLYVLVTNEGTGVFLWTRIENPQSPQSFSIAGVPDGIYSLYAFLDVNDSGTIDSGDPRSGGGPGSPLTVAGNTAADVIVSAASAEAGVRTHHWLSGTSEGYDLGLEVSGQTKQPVAVAVVSGPGLRLPVDLPKDGEFRLWAGLGSSRPSMGDAYTLVVTFSDGSKETFGVWVSGVNDSFAQNLSVRTTDPHSAAIPLFEWDAPSPEPAGSYTYRLQVHGPDGGWDYPHGDPGLPSDVLQAQYDVDGGASLPSLTSGNAYDWTVTVRDAYGNEARTQAQYTVP